jgi:hypothetical protein
MKSPIKNTSWGVFYALPLHFDSMVVEWNITRQINLIKKKNYSMGGVKTSPIPTEKKGEVTKTSYEKQSSMCQKHKQPTKE